VAIAALYPLWGAFLGGAGVAVFFKAFPLIPSVSAALWLLIAWMLLAVAEQRFLHVPGWRHVLGAAVLTPVWFYVLGSANPTRLVLAALAAHSLSRASVIAMAWVSRPSQEGMALSKKLDSFSAGLAIACGGVTAFLCGIRPAVLMLLLAFLILRLARQWYYHNLGGINATALSLTQRATELSTLLIAVFVR
jgi:cobalamin synthase